eukprot:4273669-Prorocentrum_lima.AAC.1
MGGKAPGAEAPDDGGAGTVAGKKVAAGEGATAAREGATGRSGRQFLDLELCARTVTPQYAALFGYGRG